MSEKTLNFLAKVEAWHFEKKWLHFVLAIATLIANDLIINIVFSALGADTIAYKTCDIIRAGVFVFVFWGFIVTGIREKKYGARLIRLFVVFFLALSSMISVITGFLVNADTIPERGRDTSTETYMNLIKDGSLFLIVSTIAFVVAWIIGLKLGKKAVAELEEKGFLQKNPQDF